MKRRGFLATLASAFFLGRKRATAATDPVAPDDHEAHVRLNKWLDKQPYDERDYIAVRAYLRGIYHP